MRLSKVDNDPLLLYGSLNRLEIENTISERNRGRILTAMNENDDE